MNLQSYLDRICYNGPLQVNIETMALIHRHHLLHIPYENVDVQLRRPLSLEIEPIFDKIVNMQRGGWCYEMNGLLAWALQEIGFTVRKLSGGVMRDVRGDVALGNHLVLLVTIEGTQYLADVGYGDGLFEPVPLQPGPISQRGLLMKLEEIEDGYWRFHNHTHGAAPSFDFNLKTAQVALLEQQCKNLQTDEESPFRMALVCQTFTDTGIEIQLGRVSKSITDNGAVSHVLDTADQLLARLEKVFGIREPMVRDLWPSILSRHKQFFDEKKG